MCERFHLDRNLSEHSASDLLAIIEWIDSGASFYGDLIENVRARLKDELDFRVLALVKPGDELTARNKLEITAIQKSKMMTDTEILDNFRRFLADGIRVAKRDQQPPANSIFDAESAKWKEKFFQEALDYLDETTN